MTEGTLQGTRPQRARRELRLRIPAAFWTAVPDRRFLWLKVVLALGLASSFLISYKTWVATRYFPLTPGVGLVHLPSLPAGLHRVRRYAATC